MSDNNKPTPNNMPTILVVILAILGLTTISPTGLHSPSTTPATEAGDAAPGGTAEGSSVGDDTTLGPLATIRDEEDRTDDMADSGPDALSDPIDRLLDNYHKLRFLILLVPDPNDSSMSHEFDLTLNAAQRGAESAGFVATRWSCMPGFPRTNNGTSSSPKAFVPTPTHLSGQMDGSTFTLDIKPDTPSPAPRRAWPGSVLLRQTSRIKAEEFEAAERRYGAAELRSMGSSKGSNSQMSRWKDSAIEAKNQAKEAAEQGRFLLMLLVPESPTQGVDRNRLAEAVDLIERHHELHHCCDAGLNAEELAIRIVGPNFSGTFESLARTLNSKPPRTLGEIFVIYNGRASSPDLGTFDSEKRDWNIRFKSTVHTDVDLREAMLDYIVRDAASADVKDGRPSGGEPRCAVLVEANTAFGQVSRPTVGRHANVDTFTFPLNVSRIREAYQSKGYLQSKEPMKLTSPDRLSPLEMAGRLGSRDLVPTVVPELAAVDAELGLSQMLMELERRQYEWVGICATNPLDRVFLAEKIRIACPDVRLFFTSASTLYSQRTLVPYLRGSLVASTYPLDVDAQGWTASPGNLLGGRASQNVFNSDYEEGIYNAAVAHLADLKVVAAANLLDYDYPGDDVPSPQDGATPPIWISVVGQRGMYPILARRAAPPEPADEKATAKVIGDDVGGMYYLKTTAYPKKSEYRGVLIDKSWVTLFVAFACVVLAVSGLYLRAYVGLDDATTRVSASFRERLEHPSGRTLAAILFASAAGQLALVSTPAWMLPLLEPDTFASTGLRMMLIGLAAAAAVASFAAMVVSLLRLILADRNRSIGCFEVARRAGVAGIVLACFGPPVWLAILQTAMPAPDGRIVEEAPELAQPKTVNTSKTAKAASDGRIVEEAPELAQPKTVNTSKTAKAASDDQASSSAQPLYAKADQRLYCQRATRLFNGVSPILPMLLIGSAGATVALGDWRRIGMLVRLQAVRQCHSASQGQLEAVRQTYNKIVDAVESPRKAWWSAGAWLALAPIAGAGAGAILLAGSMPGTIEPWALYRIIFLLGFGSTLGLLVLRLVEMVGVCRILDHHLRQLAAASLSRAFDRIPASLSHEGFWRSTDTGKKAAAEADPRIDRQYEAVVRGFQRCLSQIQHHPRLMAISCDSMNARARVLSSSPQLVTADWWPAINDLAPFLGPFWERRTLVAQAGDKVEGTGADDWAGAGAPELKTWLRNAEDLIAMILARQIAWLREAVQSVFAFLVVGLVLLTLVLTSYPFEPQGPATFLLTVLAALTVGAIVVVAVQASRDEVLSRLNKTPTDRFTFDRQFIATMITFVAPLLGLLGAVSYALSDLFRSLFEPFFRIG